VSSAPQPEIPFAIHQPIIIDQQVAHASAEDTPKGVTRVDTFGNPSSEAVSNETVEKKPELPTVAEQTLATEVEEASKPEVPQAPRQDLSAAGSETTLSSDVSKKTFFSAFVSPFDAFDAPAPASESVTSDVSAKKKSKKEKVVKEVPQVPANVGSASAKKADVSAVQQAPVAVEKSQPTQPSGNATAPSVPAPASTSTAAVSKRSVKQPDIPVVYRASAFVDPSQTTAAGSIPSADYTFDMSEPHLESLVHVERPFEERRVSNIRTHVMTTGLSKGSILKAGVNLLAYALPKGKARIVNQDTAESTLITLQSSDATTPLAVVDLAVTDEWVVLLGHDGSFGIWKVDFGAEGRALVCERAFFYAAKGGNLVPQRIELLGLNGETSLIIMSDDAVLSVAVEALIRSRENDLSRMVDVKYEVSQSVSNFHPLCSLHIKHLLSVLSPAAHGPRRFC
jgi:hypothetical protein